MARCTSPLWTDSKMGMRVPRARCAPVENADTIANVQGDLLGLTQTLSLAILMTWVYSFWLNPV